MASTAVELLRRRFGGKKGILPQGYTQLEYLENQLGHDAYVITNITTDNTIGFEVDGMFYDAFKTTPYGALFGGRFANFNRDFMVASFKDSDFDGQLRLGANANTYNMGIYQNTRFQASLIDNTFVCGNITTQVSKNITYPCYINVFAQGGFNSTTPITNGHGRVYSLKLYKSGVLVRDFIPCINPSNEYGLFDILNQQFYGSANSTPFTGQ